MSTQCKDYTIITELPNTKIPIEQLQRFYQRYKFAQGFCAGKRVLEVACGGGQGLQLLKNNSSFVVGGDLTAPNVKQAHAANRSCSCVETLVFDSQKLPLKKASFDVIIVFEAIYYFDDLEAFMSECKRVLSPGGVLIVSSANREWDDFNPSPFSVQYYSAQELHQLFSRHKLPTQVFTSFLISENKGIKDTIVSTIKKTAMRLNLMPKSMKYKALFKKLFIGSLVDFPPVITEGTTPYIVPEEIDPDKYYTQFKVMYTVSTFN